MVVSLFVQVLPLLRFVSLPPHPPLDYISRFLAQNSHTELSR